MAQEVQVGQIIRGYRFNGGNPRDPKMWTWMGAPREQATPNFREIGNRNGWGAITGVGKGLVHALGTAASYVPYAFGPAAGATGLPQEIAKLRDGAEGAIDRYAATHRARPSEFGQMYGELLATLPLLSERLPVGVGGAAEGLIHSRAETPLGKLRDVAEGAVLGVPTEKAYRFISGRNPRGF
jgi:hypothetical protein